MIFSNPDGGAECGHVSVPYIQPLTGHIINLQFLDTVEQVTAKAPSLKQTSS